LALVGECMSGKICPSSREHLATTLSHVVIAPSGSGFWCPEPGRISTDQSWHGGAAYSDDSSLGAPRCGPSQTEPVRTSGTSGTGGWNLSIYTGQDDVIIRLQKIRSVINCGNQHMPFWPWALRLTISFFRKEYSASPLCAKLSRMTTQ
jgi:hypothetical protein